MDSPGPSPDTHARRTAAGTVLGVYWLTDAYILGIATLFLAASLNPLIVFAIVAAVVFAINIWAGGWINRVAGWIDPGSDWWSMLAGDVIRAL